MKEHVANKVCISGLYGIAFNRLVELSQKSQKEILDFPIVFERLCVTFSIKKEEAWCVIFSLRDCGFLEIVPYHGVRLKNV